MRFEKTIKDILAIIEKEEPILRNLSEDIVSERFNSQNRSIKMLIGHFRLHLGQIHELIDE